VAVTILTSPRFDEHTTPPGHPERPERAKVMQAVADRWRVKGGDVRDPRPATRDELARVHTPAYLDLVESVRGRPAQLDHDTYTSPESVETAELAAGAAMEAARLARDGTPAFAFVRPPAITPSRTRRWASDERWPRHAAAPARIAQVFRPVRG
jgi:acetoin utilization deacetylase AcuC-like enzyme